MSRTATVTACAVKQAVDWSFSVADAGTPAVRYAGARYNSVTVGPDDSRLLRRMPTPDAAPASTITAPNRKDFRRRPGFIDRSPAVVRLKRYCFMIDFLTDV
ncbi:hypothetical protein [Streptacidiphilus sp. EB129]|uniref:hypothetical protein n=1 Tax=Streptacidiphilus sp. EB129 TaxID=3156262 RepID=UPI003512FA19